MNTSLIGTSALMLLASLMSVSAWADCPLDSKEPRFNCSSYELSLPLYTTNLVGITRTVTDPTSTLNGLRVQTNPSFTAGTATSVNNAYFSSAVTVNADTQSGSIVGFRNLVTASGTGTVGALYGVNNAYQINGIVTNAYGIYQKPTYNTGSTTTNSYNIYLATASGTGTVTKEYGLYQQSTTSNNYFGGKVGVGRSTPTERLQVGASDTSLYSPSSTSTATPWPVGTGAVTSIYNASATPGAGAYLQLNASSTSLSNHAYIGAVASASGYAPTVVIGQRTASNGYNERLRIATNGYVGIGTTTPAAALEVAGTLRVDKICDRAGANCKTLASGWSLTAESDLRNDIEKLKAENAELKKMLQDHAAQLKSLR